MSPDFYLSPDQIQSSEDGASLIELFLHELIVGNDTGTKLASTGQAIMKATRPKVLLAPLQLRLAVQIHHAFTSQFLIDSLHEHGFSGSYAEAQKFEHSLAANQATELFPLNQSQLLQHVADNTDLNIRTFHGMGKIAVLTPRKVKSKPVPRVHVTIDEIKQIEKSFKTQP